MWTHYINFMNSFCIYVISAFLQCKAPLGFSRFSKDVMAARIRSRAPHLLGRAFSKAGQSQHRHPPCPTTLLLLLSAHQFYGSFLSHVTRLWNITIIQDGKYIFMFALRTYIRKSLEMTGACKMFHKWINANKHALCFDFSPQEPVFVG